jgi:hypothetical protein
MPSLTAVVCRTAIAVVWLVALALAGGPGWRSAVLAAALVATWAAPIVLRPRLREQLSPRMAPGQAPAA